MVVVMVIMMVMMLATSGSSLTRFASSSRGLASAAGVVLVLRTEKVIQDVNDGGDVPLGLAVGVLQGRIQRAGKGARVHALAVVVHAFDDGPARGPTSLS